ncbi:MAG: hypothetical protein GY906_10110 [bacterium]|nr:hypothetical protein [bacterium]
MTHRYHPDPATDDSSDSILYNDCERCEEHAQRLVTLDRSNIAALWRAMLVWTDRLPGDWGYHTRNEITAMRQLEHMALILDHLGVDPKDLPHEPV